MQQPSQTQPAILSQTTIPGQPTILGQTNPTNQATANSALYISMLLIVPMVFILSIISYKKYRVARFKRQIKTLERIWLIDPSKRTP